MTLTATPSAQVDHRGSRPQRSVRPARRTFAECRAEITAKHVQFAQIRDPALRNELVEAHVGLARQLASKFAGRGESLEDLQQVAQMGLLNAVERYDPSLGTSFATFATPTILGELKRHFRDRVWPVRVPRRLQELYMRCRDGAELLRHEMGRSPTCEQIADHVGIAPDEVREALAVGASFRTLPMAASGEDGTLAPPPTVSDDEHLRKVEDRLVLADFVAHLPDMERHVVQLRLMDNLTQAEIAERVGISQVQVSRLLARVTKKLSEWAAEEECDVADEEGNAHHAVTTVP